MWDIREDEKGVIFKIRVQPRAAKNQVAGLFGDALKLRLTAPPVEGEANEVCRVFLAKIFKVPKRQVELVSGQTSRNKFVRVYGIDKKLVLRALKL